jgi:2'-hydroxyisoflavone reductase
VSSTPPGRKTNRPWADFSRPAAGVEPWSELPLWLPERQNGLFEARNDRAIAAGLCFRPLAETIRDTLVWDSTRPHGMPMKAGLTPERERQLLRHAKDSAH